MPVAKEKRSVQVRQTAAARMSGAAKVGDAQVVGEDELTESWGAFAMAPISSTWGGVISTVSISFTPPAFLGQGLGLC